MTILTSHAFKGGAGTASTVLRSYSGFGPMGHARVCIQGHWKRMWTVLQSTIGVGLCSATVPQYWFVCFAIEKSWFLLLAWRNYDWIPKLLIFIVLLRLTKGLAARICTCELTAALESNTNVSCWIHSALCVRRLLKSATNDLLQS